MILENRQQPVLYIVSPCYNEQSVLPVTSWEFLAKLQQLIQDKKISPESRIFYIDDGSKDQTWQIMEDLASSDPHFQAIRLSRNRGHQNALLAGLMEARKQADITISIDCDGQDDLDAMDAMVDAYLQGADVVYGVRSDRSSDTWFKRSSAQTFYRLLSWMGAEVVYNHADYRLASRPVLESLAQFPETNIYLRGMFPLVGFTSTSVYYARKEREAGSSHYPLKKMAALAFDGITSLSTRPLRMIIVFGILMAILALVGILWAILQNLRGATVSGWASMICILLFGFGSLEISIGILGEYIGKIYMETKHRPRWIIASRTSSTDPSKDSAVSEEMQGNRKEIQKNTREIT